MGTDDELDLHRGDEPPTAAFAGHDALNSDQEHHTIPFLAGARTIGQAVGTGSPRARHRARVMGFLLLAPFAVGLIIQLWVWLA